MIVIQTPLRVSFFGGGTDFPDYYRREGGCVLSTAIDKYIYFIIKRRFDAKLRIGYTRTELVDSVDQIEHELIREALRHTGITQGVEVATMGDIPSRGSGLGSSSTVTVGALHAMYAYRGELVSAEQLARAACAIELDALHKPIGIQDQYIAAYGGLRFFEFQPDDQVVGRLLPLDNLAHRTLSHNLMLFYTGITRPAGDILTEQQANIVNRLPILRQMKQLAYSACTELLAGNVAALGELLHEGWLLKRQMASRISNAFIDDIYAAARRAGAMGGKITGAGGGGFLLLYCPIEKQPAVRAALAELQELPFRLEPDGSKAIFNYKRI